MRLKIAPNHLLKLFLTLFLGFSGFSEVKAACCGSGRLKAQMACIPKASYCNNREKYLFWDKYHPTQQAHHFFSDLIFNGPRKYTFPINVQTLVAIQL